LIFCVARPRITFGDSALEVLNNGKPCNPPAGGLLKVFLFLRLLSKLNGCKTKKPWSANWLTGPSVVARPRITFGDSALEVLNFTLVLRFSLKWTLPGFEP
jgi:hypothetical protein